MAAPTRAQYSKTEVAASGTLSPVLGSAPTVAAGRLLIAVVISNTTTALAVGINGWTRADSRTNTSNLRGAVYWRTPQSGDTATLPKIVTTALTGAATIHCWEWSGCNTIAPLFNTTHTNSDAAAGVNTTPTETPGYFTDAAHMAVAAYEDTHTPGITVGGSWNLESGTGHTGVVASGAAYIIPGNETGQAATFTDSDALTNQHALTFIFGVWPTSITEPIGKATLGTLGVLQKLGTQTVANKGNASPSLTQRGTQSFSVAKGNATLSLSAQGTQNPLNGGGHVAFALPTQRGSQTLAQAGKAALGTLGFLVRLGVQSVTNKGGASPSLTQRGTQASTNAGAASLTGLGGISTRGSRIVFNSGNASLVTGPHPVGKLGSQTVANRGSVSLSLTQRGTQSSINGAGHTAFAVPTPRGTQRPASGGRATLGTLGQLQKSGKQTVANGGRATPSVTTKGQQRLTLGTGNATLTLTGRGSQNKLGTAFLTPTGFGTQHPATAGRASLTLVAHGVQRPMPTGRQSLSVVQHGSQVVVQRGAHALTLTGSGRSAVTTSGGVRLFPTQRGTQALQSFGHASLALAVRGTQRPSIRSGDAVLTLAAHGTQSSAQAGRRALAATGLGRQSVVQHAAANQLFPSARGTQALHAQHDVLLPLGALGTQRTTSKGSAALTLTQRGTQAKALAVGGVALALAGRGVQRAVGGGHAAIVPLPHGAQTVTTHGRASLALTARGTQGSSKTGHASLALMAHGVQRPLTFHGAALTPTAHGIQAPAQRGNVPLAIRALGRQQYSAHTFRVVLTPTAQGVTRPHQSGHAAIAPTGSGSQSLGRYIVDPFLVRTYIALALAAESDMEKVVAIEVALSLTPAVAVQADFSRTVVERAAYTKATVVATAV